MERVQISEQAGTEYCLKEVLQRWQLPDHFHAHMSSAWRCKLAVPCEADADVLAAVMDAAPALVPQECGARVCEAVGADALQYVQREEWDTFPKPRVAMVSGWGAPGTRVAGADYVTLVHSFSELLRSRKTVNLQLFHRTAADAPRLPALPELLDWPAAALLDGRDGSWGVKCDRATRVSQRGAVTWWHLDDGGELVLQVAAPAAEARMQGPVLIGPGGEPVVKLFLFAPAEHYDIIAQDEVTNTTQRFNHLDPFTAKIEDLPSGAEERGLLPTFWLAPLEAGGRPLLSPPNAPHLVLTLQDCVMAEERKIFKLLVDEVDAFLRRAALWSEPPIMYPFIRETLASAAGVAEVVQDLTAVLDGGRGKDGAQAQCALDHGCSREQAQQCVHDDSAAAPRAAGEQAGGKCSEAASDRQKPQMCVRCMQRQRAAASLQALLQSKHVCVAKTAQTTAEDCLFRHHGANTASLATKSIVARQRACSRRVKGVTFLPAELCSEHPGQSSCSSERCDGYTDVKGHTGNNAIPCNCEARDSWAAHIHVDGKPRWGPLRAMPAAAKADRQRLLAARRSSQLDTALHDLRASEESEVASIDVANFDK